MGGRYGRRGRDDGVATEFNGVFVPNDAEDGLAAVEGHLANLRLHLLPAGIERLRAFHLLRTAARTDPHAAYNLASLLFEGAKPARPRRAALSHRLFERTVDRGLAELRDPDEPFAKAPHSERDLRDVVSRALTNLGAILANAGHLDRAVPFFRRAVKIFPRNSDGFVCLGNMGVYHSHETGVAPLDGIAFWEEAHDLGNLSPGNRDETSWRARLVALAREVEKNYGSPAASSWMSGPMHGILREGRSSPVCQIVRTLSEAARADGEPWSRATSFASEVAHGVMIWGRALPVEARATIAASLVATLSRGRNGGGPDRKAIGKALALLSVAEPLVPYLGDHEWQEAAPPLTDYLVDPSRGFDIRVRKLAAVVDSSFRSLPVSAPELCAAVLFHVGGRFRRTVCNLAAQVQALPGEAVLYAPATHLAGETRQTH